MSDKRFWVIVRFQAQNTAQHQFSLPSKKTTWSRIWDPIRPGGDPPSRPPQRILCPILSTSISEPLGINTLFLFLSMTSVMIEPYRFPSNSQMFFDAGAKFSQISWVWVRWLDQWKLADSKEIRHFARTFPISHLWLNPPLSLVFLQKLDDLSIRESDSSNPEENITLFLDMHQDDLEMERRRWVRWRRCHFLILSLCAVSAVLSFICIVAFVLTFLQSWIWSCFYLYPQIYSSCKIR